MLPNRPKIQVSAGRSLPRKLVLVLLDAILLSAALTFSFLVRFDMGIPGNQQQIFFLYLFVSISLRIVVFWWANLYDISFRFVSLRDLWTLGKATTITTILNTIFGGLLVPLILGGGRVPLSILVLDSLFTIMCAGGLRVSKRIYLDLLLPGQFAHDPSIPRTLIVGAGDAADQLLRYLRRTKSRAFHPVGLLDDDPLKKGVMVHGIPVIGALDKLGEMIPATEATVVLIAIPSASITVLRSVYAEARKAGVLQIKILNSELVQGSQHFEVDVKDIREIKIEDLLGRTPVELATEEIRECLQGARVLITGGSGSIGSEIVRQVCRYAPEAVVFADMDETGLFNLDLELCDMLAREGLAVEPRPWLVDIRNPRRVEDLFDSFRPTIVYHAAAYKHVPMMEKHPEEALATNILGTRTVAEAADRHGVERFIFVSTDKSVNPRNVMGATKRVAGMICYDLQKESDTRFMTVRFGNVLGSRGSVIPIFLDQLKHGGPITVTHPEMVRYFMTIPEAVSLVLETGAIGEGGEVFVLDMGKPVKIMTLAEEIVRMHGQEPHKDIPIKIVGMRPGEKLYEELLTSEEGTSSTTYDKILKANLGNDEGRFGIDEIVARVDALLSLSHGADRRTQIITFLRELVPSFVPDDMQNKAK